MWLVPELAADDTDVWQPHHVSEFSAVECTYRKVVFSGWYAAHFRLDWSEFVRGTVFCSYQSKAECLYHLLLPFQKNKLL